MKTQTYSAKGVDLEQYKQWGIDISLLVSSLNMTPTERVENNNSLLCLVDEIRKAKPIKQFRADTPNQ